MNHISRDFTLFKEFEQKNLVVIVWTYYYYWCNIYKPIHLDITLIIIVQAMAQIE
jgi:hypothetical protein